MCAVSKTSWVRVYIGLGANVGDRMRFLQQALQGLRQTEGFILTRVSPFYETEPIGFTAQGPFLNGVAEGETSLPPRTLLEILKAIEKEVGRVNREEWGPREIDLDLLFYGESIIEEPLLTLPHPRLHERDFVLVPLASLCPTFEHPKLRKRIQELLEGCVSFHASHPKPYSIEVAGEAL